MYVKREDIFGKTGFLGRQREKPVMRIEDEDPVTDLNRIKMTERFGVGILGDKAIATVNGVKFADSYPSSAGRTTQGITDVFDRASGKIKDGENMLMLTHKASHILPNSITVYRNGGEALEEGRDFARYLGAQGYQTLQLSRAIKSTDDDIEVRYQVDLTKMRMVEDVLLLPRDAGSFSFEDEQLLDLLPNMGDLFDVSKLMRHGNVKLADKVGSDFRVMHVEVRKEGIIASGEIIPKYSGNK